MSARFGDLPLIPDGDEAREWAERELADPVYDIAEPTLFDRMARAVSDLLAGIFSGGGAGDWGGLLALLAAVVVVVVIVAAFVVWGMPRARRRAAASAAPLFDETETRSAGQLRRDADGHARRGEWDAAIVLRFRALARGTVERGVVEIPPGATVHAFARRAAVAFPASAGALEGAASAFDDVRYLRRPGTSELYARVAGADDTIAGTRPAPRPEPVGVGG